MEKAVSRAYEECVVHEAIVFHEGVEAKDDFGYPQSEGLLYPLRHSSDTLDDVVGNNHTSNNNTKPPEGGVCAAVTAWSQPDYTKQLQFHEAELAQAEQRGFPPGQIEYHAGKIAVLRGL